MVWTQCIANEMAMVEKSQTENEYLTIAIRCDLKKQIIDA